MDFFTGTAKPHQGKKFLREVVSSWHKQLSYTCQKWKFLYYAGKKKTFSGSVVLLTSQIAKQFQLNLPHFVMPLFNCIKKKNSKTLLSRPTPPPGIQLGYLKCIPGDSSVSVKQDDTNLDRSPT